jgi:hypothetical protein
VLSTVTTATGQLLAPLPETFLNSSATWAWLTYDNAQLGILPGAFNRSVFDTPAAAEASDARLKEA